MPPAFIAPRGQSELVHNELVSNPVPRGFDQIVTRPQRLIVYYFNERQVASKMVNKNKTANYIKTQLANITDMKPEDINMFKFIHRELEDNSLVSEFVNTRGATYITAFPNKSELKDLSANLIFHELRPDPVQFSRPDNTPTPLSVIIPSDEFWD